MSISLIIAIFEDGSPECPPPIRHTTQLNKFPWLYLVQPRYEEANEGRVDIALYITQGDRVTGLANTTYVSIYL